MWGRYVLGKGRERKCVCVCECMFMCVCVCVCTYILLWICVRGVERGGKKERGRERWREQETALIIIIIIIVAFKGAIREFLQSPHSTANCLQHIRSSGSGPIVCKSRATHRALIMCMCHVTCHLVRRDSSVIKFDRVEIAFI